MKECCRWLRIYSWETNLKSQRVYQTQTAASRVYSLPTTAEIWLISYYKVCLEKCSLVLLFSGSVMSDSLRPWTATLHAFLSFTISRSLLKFMSTELVMPSSHLIFCCPLLLQSFPVAGSFPVSWLFVSGGQSIGVSTLASVLPINIQGWFPLGLTGLISLQSKGISRDFSSSTVWKRQCFDT